VVRALRDGFSPLVDILQRIPHSTSHSSREMSRWNTSKCSITFLSRLPKCLGYPHSSAREILRLEPTLSPSNPRKSKTSTRNRRAPSSRVVYGSNSFPTSAEVLPPSRQTFVPSFAPSLVECQKFLLFFLSFSLSASVLSEVALRRLRRPSMRDIIVIGPISIVNLGFVDVIIFSRSR